MAFNFNEFMFGGNSVTKNQTYTPSGQGLGALGKAEGWLGGVNPQNAPLLNVNDPNYNQWGAFLGAGDMAHNNPANPYFNLGSMYVNQSAQAPDTQSFLDPYRQFQLENWKQYAADPAMRNARTGAVGAAGGISNQRNALANQNAAYNINQQLGGLLSGQWNAAAAQAQAQRQAQQAAGALTYAAAPNVLGSQLSALGFQQNTGNNIYGIQQGANQAQYNQQQQAFTTPFQLAQMYAGLAPSYGGTTQGQTTYPQPGWGAILGAFAGSAAGSKETRRGGRIGYDMGGGVNPFAPGSGPADFWRNEGQSLRGQQKKNPYDSIAKKAGAGVGGSDWAEDAKDYLSDLTLANGGAIDEDDPTSGPSNFLDNMGAKKPQGPADKAATDFGKGVGKAARMAMMFIKRGGPVKGYEWGGAIEQNNPWAVEGYEEGGDIPFDDRWGPVRKALASGDFDPVGENNLPPEIAYGDSKGSPFSATGYAARNDLPQLEGRGAEPAIPDVVGGEAAPERVPEASPLNPSGLPRMAPGEAENTPDPSFMRTPNISPFSMGQTGGLPAIPNLGASRFSDRLNSRIFLSGLAKGLQSAGTRDQFGLPGGFVKTAGAGLGGTEEAMKAREARDIANKQFGFGAAMQQLPYSQMTAADKAQLAQAKELAMLPYSQLTAAQKVEALKPFQYMTDPITFTPRYGIRDPQSGQLIDVQTGKPVTELFGHEQPGQGDKSTPEGYRKHIEGISPNIASNLKAIYELRRAPPPQASRSPAAIAENTHLQRAYPDYDVNDWTTAQNTSKAFSANGPAGQQLRRFDTYVQHSQVLIEAMDALALAEKTGDFRPFNAIKLKWADLTNRPLPAKFNAIRDIYADEAVASVVGPRNALGDREEIRKRIRETDSPSTLRAVAEGHRELAIGAVGAFERQYDHGYKNRRNDFRDRFLPETKKLLDKYFPKKAPGEYTNEGPGSDPEKIEKVRKEGGEQLKKLETFQSRDDVLKAIKEKKLKSGDEFLDGNGIKRMVP